MYRISRKLSFSLSPILEGQREREGGARTGVREIEAKLKFVCNFEQKGLSLVSARWKNLSFKQYTKERPATKIRKSCLGHSFFRENKRGNFFELYNSLGRRFKCRRRRHKTASPLLPPQPPKKTILLPPLLRSEGEAPVAATTDSKNKLSPSGAAEQVGD